MQKGKRKSDGAKASTLRGMANAEKEKNSNKKAKPSYSHPLVAKWPAISAQDTQIVFRKIREHFKGLEREARPRLKYQEYKERKEADAEEMKQGNVQMKSGNSRFRSQMLCLGVNAVTKALEKNLLDLVIVVRSVTPNIITQHLPVMLFTNKVPCIPLHCDCKELGKIFGMKTVVAIGLKKIPELDEVTKDLLQYSKLPSVPWLDSDSKVKYIPIYNT